ncbi:hypothetical protein BDW59DRAFT_160378 [Aspergillus cavernicola]|uniref:Nascent polypeptide-associated complex subunit alpha-like UBA domain-containing protein n=1 Tax=Aspergillus cavernicola TaxID=176166 RepID=A0ABR4IJL2_9EURO
MSDHPIPSTTSTTSPQTTSPPASTSVEDRKAAAALSSLHSTEITTDPNTTAAADSKPRSSADQEALGKAMSRLEIAAGQKGKGAVKSSAGKKDGEGDVKKRSGAGAVVVKVSAEDVGLLVNELDLSKGKATELLKANEGDVKKALVAFIRPGSTIGSSSVSAVGA